MSSRGQLVVPRQVREQVGLEPGDQVSVQALDDSMLAAEKAERTAFEIAMTRLREEMERRGTTQADIDRAVEEVKQEIYDEIYGPALEIAS
jgi:AbrB family looped-hinge helix DNA binding protein